MADGKPDKAALDLMAKRLRRDSIEMTTAAGSGHPTTCMSAAEVMAVLFFDEMKLDVTTPESREADVFVMSKGHAAPVWYAALKECGAIDDDILTLRKSSSRLEGHPVPRLPWVKIATGSLGQGLSAAAGMAVTRKMDGLSSRVYCLMGDGETAEGSIWEAAQFAASQKLDNLVGIVDMNALGQSGPTMHKDDGKVMAGKFAAFGWDTAVVDGHDVDAVKGAFSRARRCVNRPFAVIAMTKKGKGVSFTEGKEGWHGKAMKKDEAQKALAELGEANISLKAIPPAKVGVKPPAMPAKQSPKDLPYKPGEEVATREAYGFALARLGPVNPTVVVTDADVKNSTFADKFLKAFPDRFVEAFIAEQNMIGAALGMATEGKTVFASSFACFLSRGYDFIRMAGYSRRARLILCGSHAGVSIGEDGPSQMALEDIAMMRPIFGSYVLYPSDAVCAEKLVYEAAAREGIGYIRTSRPKTKVIYATTEEFPIGGSKTVKSSGKDVATVIGAGITLYEALKAYETLKAKGREIRVIDAYSIKPIDEAAVLKAAKETGNIITVEDHSVLGGLGGAVCEVVAGKCPVKIMGIRDIPKSATPDELVSGYGIGADSIVKAVEELTK
jgi:transketolase